MNSLRLRLLIGTFCWISITLLVAGFALTQLFAQHVEQQLTVELQSHLDQLTAQIELDDELSLNNEPSDPRFNRPLSGLYWQIDADNESLRSRSLWDQKLNIPPASKKLVPIYGLNNTPLLALVRHFYIEDENIQLLVAIEANALDAPLQRFNTELWLALVVLGLGLIIAAFVQVHFGLKPLKRLRQEIQAIRLGENNYLSPHYPSEISPLADEFNVVLKTHQTSVERARTQAGNLAHALKTPLSVLANAAAEQQTEFAHLVATQTEQARTQVDYHLSRARAAALRSRGNRTQVKGVLAGLERVLSKVYADKNLVFDIQCRETIYFLGEAPELQELLGNLLDNACKWAKTTVHIYVQQHEQQVEISIEDDGQGLSAEQKQQALQRGVRLDERTPGSGLGLSIVRELIDDFGGHLELHDSPLGGLKAVLFI